MGMLRIGFKGTGYIKNWCGECFNNRCEVVLGDTEELVLKMSKRLV